MATTPALVETLRQKSPGQIELNGFQAQLVSIYVLNELSSLRAQAPSGKIDSYGTVTVAGTSGETTLLLLSEVQVRLAQALNKPMFEVNGRSVISHDLAFSDPPQYYATIFKNFPISVQSEDFPSPVATVPVVEPLP